MKKPSSAGDFDPKGRYAGVRQQQGRVQSDTDWNEAGQAGSRGRVGRRGPAWILASAVLVGLAGLVVAVVVVGRSLLPASVRSPFSEILPTGSNPILVALKEPADQGRYPAGGVLQVTAQALGADPIVSLELWADGSLADTASFQGENRRYVMTSWDWSVPSLGEHMIIVRAVDGRGRTGESNIVRLTGIPDSGLLVRHTSSREDTPQALAAAFEVDLGAVLRANPGLRADQALPAGAEVVIPIEGAAPADVQEQAPGPPQVGAVDPASQPPDPASFWVRDNILGGSAQPPSAPDLNVTSAGCTARLFVTDTSADEDGFFVYRIGPGASTFARLATLGAHSGAGAINYEVMTTGGASQFYVSAFNTGGESASNIVAFEAPASACAPSPSGGTGLRLEGDTLILPDGLDLAFLYYSVDGGPWGRLPADAHTYYQPDGDAVALGGLFQGSSADLEVWGWDGGSLAFVGTLHTDSSTHPAPFFPIVAGPSQLDGCPIAKCSGDIGDTLWAKEITIGKWLSQGFRWFAPMEGVTGGLWQVSAQPFASSCSLTPPDLLLSDLVETSGGWTYFPVDFSPLAPLPLEIGNQPAQESVAKGQPVFPGLPSLGQDSLLEMQATPNVVLLGGGPQETGAFPRFYVRMLPLVGGQPQCQPSNTVVVTYDPTPQPQITFAVPDYSRFVAQYHVEIIEYTPPVFPDPNLWGCVQVVSVDAGSYNPLNIVWGQATGDIVCPKSFQGGSGQGLGGLLSLVGAAWDYVADLYNKLDNLVKDFVAKFNPICLTASWTAEAADSGQAKTTIEDGCKVGAAIAVDAAKAYVGLPPSLPKYEQLEGAGKDYLVELAAEEFEATTGIPCPDECKDLMRDGVDMAFDQLNAGSRSPACVSETVAHEHGREPLCPPPGVVVKPALGSEYIPPVAWLRVTRLPNKPENAPAPDPEPFPTCITGVSMTVEYEFPGGNVYGPYSPTGTPSIYVPAQSATVLPYQGNSAKIPRMAPGEQVTLAIPFRGVFPVLFPWTKAAYQGYQEAPNQYNEDFYTAMRYGAVHLRAYTVWPEYEALREQYPAAADLDCAAPAELVAPPSP